MKYRMRKLSLYCLLLVLLFLLQHTLAGYEYDSYNISHFHIRNFSRHWLRLSESRQSDGAYYGFHIWNSCCIPLPKYLSKNRWHTQSWFIRIFIHVIEEHLLSNDVTEKFWRLDDIENDEPSKKCYLNLPKNPPYQYRSKSINSSFKNDPWTVDTP